MILCVVFISILFSEKAVLLSLCHGEIEHVHCIWVMSYFTNVKLPITLKYFSIPLDFEITRLNCILFNPFKSNGISQHYQLDQSISVLRAVWWYLEIFDFHQMNVSCEFKHLLKNI